MPLFAVDYLRVVDGSDDFFQFDEKGLFVEQGTTPVELKEGYIVLSGKTPLTLEGPFTTIVLQSESIMAIGKRVDSNPTFYLVGGSASFLTTSPFSGKLDVTTPVARYTLDGAGEIFVTSDASELVFALSGVVKATNAITRQVTTLGKNTYLNMADPFRTLKPITEESYLALSIGDRPVKEKEVAKVVEVKEEPKAVVEEVKPVEVAKPVEVENPLIAKPVEVEKPVEVVKPVEPKEVTTLYIVHTADTLGVVNEKGIGFSRLKTLLDWSKEYFENTLVLDAGNAISGTPLADAFKGEVIGQLIEMVGYDAIAPGPADYAFGEAYLIEMAQLAKDYSDLSVLAANRTEDGFDPYKIYNFNGLKVGVIGVSLTDDLEVDDFIITVAQQLVDEVASQSDVVVALGNFPTNSLLTSTNVALTLNNIDLIVDGSSANLGPAGKVVNDTLIVSSAKELQSIGVVEVITEDKAISSMIPLQISAQEVNDPTQSSLAQALGIYTVPYDPQVDSFVASAKAQLEKDQEVVFVSLDPEAKEIKVEEVAVRDDDAITIKQPSGVVSATESGKGRSDWGVSATFNLTRDTFDSGTEPLVGFSINPFIRINNFALGLQAFFLTKDSLFTPATYDPNYTSRVEKGPTLPLISSLMRFIDYVEYGQPGDKFYLLADDSTPINFANRILVNNYGVASAPREEALGFYSNLKLGMVGIESFFDNLYLDNLTIEEVQTGGLRVAINSDGAFEFGVSSLIEFNLADQLKLYPSLDFIWRMKNERKIGVNLFGALATKVDAKDLKVEDFFDKDSAKLLEKFPNFLLAGGLDVRTLRWNFRFVGSLQNKVDDENLLTLGSVGSTHRNVSYQ
ncbi:MAG: hypothetical protein ACOXZZ_01900 [Sphaerochaetaceae bacterium]